MAAILTSPDRDTNAGMATLFGTMTGYAAPYRIESDDQFITRVDLASTPGQVGTDQVRLFTIEDDTCS